MPAPPNGSTIDAAAAPPVPARERRWLEQLHGRYHHRRFVSPDPLEFLYAYDDVDDREVAGLVASALAYGNVTAMLTAIESVLAPLGLRPARALAATRPSVLRSRLRRWRYRFTSGPQIAGLLLAARTVRAHHGSLGACLDRHADPEDETVVPALGGFAAALRDACEVPLDHLLPAPAGGSACKRLCLYLRWMVRRDTVDPGGWTGVRPDQLVMPLDVHVLRTARERGWLRRRTPDLKAALEVTAFLRRVRPDDPLRYDFSVTRPGIRRVRRGA